ncbi:type II secretion system protein GspL [Acidiferrobacter sp.]|uniref:type II secretion system protein GspL n=1 Tax=Acidiferrobacter sp. TaxID=1872107 RepID=UPI002611EC73|nr:type II secretion system protein GspL [Acidiferrobacter sp.]
MGASSYPAGPRLKVGAHAWHVFLARTFPEDPCVEWRTPQGEIGQGPLSLLPEAARRGPIHVWSPSPETLLSVAPWPGRSRRRLAQALPYLLEEQLLADPAALEFSYRDTGAGVFVAVTAKERLAAWGAALGAARLRARVCPVTFALAWHARSWSCCVRAGQWVLRTGPLSGFGAAGSPTQIPAAVCQAFEGAVKAGRAPEVIVVFEGDEALRARITAAFGIPVTADPRPLALGQVPPFDLCEAGGAALAGGRAALDALRPAVIALSLMFVLGFGGTLIDWMRLARAQASLRAQMTKVFRGSFPHVPVLDPARQMRAGWARLAAGSGAVGPGLLTLLASAGPVLAGLKESTLMRLTYRHGQVHCLMRMARLSTLRALRRDIGRRGLSMRVVRVTSRRAGIQVQITITGSGP